MENADFQNTLLRRLNLLIILMLDTSSSEGPQSTTKRIERLTKIGLPPSEIAEIIGKNTNYVTAVLHGKKKAKRSQK